MARRVFKYPLQLTSGPQEVKMPPSFILHVHEQNGAPCLWAEVDPSADPDARTFYVVATGEDVPPGGNYVGTVHIGWTVWHIYDDHDEPF